MPSLTVDNIPIEIYEQLQRRAEERRHSLQEEALHLLRQVLEEKQSAPASRLPDLIPQEEHRPPCDLPRPRPAGIAPAQQGGPRLPDLIPGSGAT